MLIRGISISGLVLVICFLLARPNESDGRLNLQSTDLPGTGRVSVLSEKLSKPKLSCSEEFITHNLDHYTSVEGDTVDQFEANGAGVALGDLDGDSDLDVVLGNDSGTNTILWNQAAQNLDEGLFPNFLSEHMPFGNTRAVNLVDVDADGRLDIVMTRRNGAFNYLRNTPQTISEQSLSGIKRVTETGFVHQVLPGIAWPAYAMNWADLDLDGDLDLVTGSYDASLLENQGNDFLIGNGAGVFIYTNQEGKFVPNRLAEKAQAMAVAFFDINRDKLKDIVVGNDFAVPDYAWLRLASNASSVNINNKDKILEFPWSLQVKGWIPTSFDTTSYSTMSLDIGDVDNDQISELYSTDMMPYDETINTVAAYEPLMADMDHERNSGDPQIMANVLLVNTGVVGYQDAARPRGLDATGWSWSAKFGDLDQDGLLDLYVVNGMAESTIFAHLDNHELIEANQVFRNIGNGYFKPAPEWKVGSTFGGRGMSMGDMDGDGDLDIVINNLRGPAQLLENRLCGGESLQVDLQWHNDSPSSFQPHIVKTRNTLAIGAVVHLKTSSGNFTRDVRAASGYLSGDPPRLHFGFPAGTSLYSLEIHWPDNIVSIVKDLSPKTLVKIRRQSGFFRNLRIPQKDSVADQNKEETERKTNQTYQPKINCDEPNSQRKCWKVLNIVYKEKFNQQLRKIITQHGLTGDPGNVHDLPSIEEPLAQLGKKLFFSKALGGDMDSACASCHHPLLGGGDALSVSIGVGAHDQDLLGSARTHPEGPTVSRNAPTTFNVAFFKHVLTHDGRFEKLSTLPDLYNFHDQSQSTLQNSIRTPDSLFGQADPNAGADLVGAQSRFPLTMLDEMRGFEFEAHRPGRFARRHISARLGDYGEGRGELQRNMWQAEFQTVFGKSSNPRKLINETNIAKALSAYQRSQVFLNSPWQAYVRGNEDAINSSSKRGALLFFKSVVDGGAGCAACHSGDFFTDEKFHVLALPQVGPGKEDGRFHDDFGRFRESGNPNDLYAFRTPTLLNVEVTGPYGHDGAYTTLEGIIKHHLNPSMALDEYDVTQLDPAVQTQFLPFNTERALSKLEENREAGLPAIRNIKLTDPQVIDISSFLLTLTDPCVKNLACLNPWIPDDDDSDPDGLRLKARILTSVAQ